MSAMTAKLPMTRSAQSSFQVRLLAAGEVRLALPVAQLLYPALTEESWIAYTSGSQGSEVFSPRRVLGAFNPGGYLHGLCTLSDGFDLRSGRTLIVDDLIVADFLDTRSVIHALLVGIEELARKESYRGIRVSLADGNLLHQQAVVDALNSNGNLRTSACYCKPLAQPSRPIAGA